jgi:hypothetical protein
VGADPGTYAQRLSQAAQAVRHEPNAEQVRLQLAEAIAAMRSHAALTDDPVQAAMAEATVTLLAASSAAMEAVGVCKAEEPYADLYAVLGSDGRVHYCCTHAEKHCSK